jgi:hypothetical protein
MKELCWLSRLSRLNLGPKRWHLFSPWQTDWLDFIDTSIILLYSIQEYSSWLMNRTFFCRARKRKSLPDPLSWSAHALIFGWIGSLSLLLCIWQEVWSRKLKCFFLVMKYSALFNNVFEAVNLLLLILLYLCSRSLITRQWHLTRVLSWLVIGDFHHILYKWFIPAACADSSLLLSISACHFKLLSEYKTWIPAPLLQLSMTRCQSGSLL